MKKGFFMTFEGIDGCGKGTQIKNLRQLLEKLNIDSFFIREPGGSPICEKIRDIILDKSNDDITDISEMLLFAASRATLVEKYIKPALEMGKIVVCDRFVDSSIAYQGGARGLGVELVESVNKIALNGLYPDLVVLLDLDGSVGAKRNQQMGGKEDRIELEGIAFQNKVRQTYLEIARKNPDKYLIIDASKPIEVIFDLIVNELKNRGVINYVGL